MSGEAIESGEDVQPRRVLNVGDRLLGRPCLVTIEAVDASTASGPCESCGGSHHLIDRTKYEAGGGPWRLTHDPECSYLHIDVAVCDCGADDAHFGGPTRYIEGDCDECDGWHADGDTAACERNQRGHSGGSVHPSEETR